MTPRLKELYYKEIQPSLKISLDLKIYIWVQKLKKLF